MHLLYNLFSELLATKRADHTCEKSDIFENLIKNGPGYQSSIYTYQQHQITRNNAESLPGQHQR